MSGCLDLYDRTLVGYEIGGNNNNPLVFKSLDKAIADNPNTYPLVHNDGRYQYYSSIFLKNIICSKACLEFVAVLIMVQMYYGKQYDVKEELINTIHTWITYYTYVRYQRRFRVRISYEVRSEVLKDNSSFVSNT